MSNELDKLRLAFESVEKIVLDALHEKQQLDFVKNQWGAFPPGHFYSTIPNLETLETYYQSFSSSIPEVLPDIDLNAEGQVALLKELSVFGKDLIFPEFKTSSFRYYYQNPFYSYTDAIFLHCMLRYLKPRRIIEVGSGFSSCMILDTNEQFFNDQHIQCDFIEPYPERLLENLRPSDLQNVNLLKQSIQTVDLSYFDSLEPQDILFIDSTHVSKLDSDVNHLLFKVMPRLKPGVFIHFHDIFYPFEYPEAFYRQGFYWNECYLLRAFLMNNASYKIRLFSDYLQRFHRDSLEMLSPLCLKNTGGNIWLEKR